MNENPSRRLFLSSAAAVLAAPAIVRASSLMPVNPLIVPKKEVWVGWHFGVGWDFGDGYRAQLSFVVEASNDGVSWTPVPVCDGIVRMAVRSGEKMPCRFLRHRIVSPGLDSLRVV